MCMRSYFFQLLCDTLPWSTPAVDCSVVTHFTIPQRIEGWVDPFHSSTINTTRPLSHTFYDLLHIAGWYWNGSPYFCDQITDVVLHWMYLFVNLTNADTWHLQILTRRLRFRLERAPGESMLIDRTGRNLKMEPLATVSSLERHLLKMVTWFELLMSIAYCYSWRCFLKHFQE